MERWNGSRVPMKPSEWPARKGSDVGSAMIVDFDEECFTAMLFLSEQDEIVARMLSVDDSSGCHVAEGLVMRCSVAVNSGLWTCYVFLVKGFCLCLSQATSSGL